MLTKRPLNHVTWDSNDIESMSNPRCNHRSRSCSSDT